MKITVEVTQEELDEMNMDDPGILLNAIYEDLESGRDYVGYNVEVVMDIT